jgi:hypothetical protein
LWRRCRSCRQVRACVYSEDPFSAEIRNNHTKVWLCDNCWRQSKEDI